MTQPIRPAVGLESAAPGRCPTCGSPAVVTTSKVVTTESYWRCEACGEVWNQERQEKANRYSQRYGFGSRRRY
jgi:transposase-like protein